MRIAPFSLLLLTLAHADDLDDDLIASRQRCEMCGLLVLQLETLGLFPVVTCISTYSK